MPAFTAEDMKFYRETYPALNMPGWQETGSHAYGEIWWRKPVETASNQIKAELCLLVLPNHYRISLEVRIQSQWLVCAKAPEACVSPSQVEAWADATLPDAELAVIQQYEEWHKNIDKEFDWL